MELSKEDRIEIVDSSFNKAIAVISINCKENNEKQLALQKLEEARFWAMKSIYNEKI